MNLECRILPTSTRNLRQTKAEMRRELEELKWNIRHGDGPPQLHHTPTSNAGSHGDPQMLSPLDHGSASFSGDDGSRSMSPIYATGEVRSGPPTRKGSGQHANIVTMPRVLDGYVVDARRIEDCFTLYVKIHVTFGDRTLTETIASSRSITPCYLFWTNHSLQMSTMSFLLSFSGALSLPGHVATRAILRFLTGLAS